MKTIVVDKETGRDTKFLLHSTYRIFAIIKFLKISIHLFYCYDSLTEL
ncbi:hypothetical protein HYE05_00965 [Mycoplasmopsis bovis]|nr:hypothetical protein HYE05_00965 [Mycoplasmopsis bovis]